MAKSNVRIDLIALQSSRSALHPTPPSDWQLSHLLRSPRSTRVRVWAEGARFGRKDVPKTLGHRCNGDDGGRPKAWWTDVDEGDLPS